MSQSRKWEQTLQPAVNEWLMQQIKQLSLKVLSDNVFTCTACHKVSGDYIIEYQDTVFRVSTEGAYAFLKYAEAGNLSGTA